MQTPILTEITPLTSNECFNVLYREKHSYCFPMHRHNEFELNFIMNAAGAKRIVGNSIEIIGNNDLVMVGSNLCHQWLTHQCTETKIQEITIHWHKDLFDGRLLQTNHFNSIRRLLEQAQRGIFFGQVTAGEFSKRLYALQHKSQFEIMLDFFSILHFLSIATDIRLLCSVDFNNKAPIIHPSRRITKVYAYMQANYDSRITLHTAANLVHMADATFCKFFKEKTGTNFIDALNDIRIGHASSMLVHKEQSVSEIAYSTGFNNIAYFNRVFKKKKYCTPKQFKAHYK